MPRSSYSGVARDGNGHIISSATISVCLAGTDTVATIYAAGVGGVPVPYVSSGSDGAFVFYVDYADYTLLQKFKIYLSKAGFTTATIDNIDIVHNYTYSPSGLKWSDFA
jgi:hypothetical protein